MAGATIGTLGSQAGDYRRGAIVGALVAAAADLDFIPGLLLGSPARFHHAQSHSLTFALAAAVLAALVASRARLRWAWIAFLAYVSHLGLDLVTFDDGAPYGIPLFWPLSGRTFLSPVTLLPRVPHSDGALLSWPVAKLVVLEMALLGPFLAWTIYWSRRRRAVRASAGERIPIPRDRSSGTTGSE